MKTPVGEEIKTNDARQARRAGMAPILIMSGVIALIGMAVVFGIQSV